MALLLSWGAGTADADEAAATDSLADLLIEVQALLDAPPGDRDGGFEYSADDFIDYVEGDSILLRGHAVVLHRGARLEAPEMVYHRGAGTVEARAATDGTATGDSTTAVDSTATVGRKGRPGAAPQPSITRGDESVRGQSILYHLETGRGVVRRGRVEFKDGFYSGRYIRTLSADEFHVHAGSYTTCDLPHPHFDFYSPRIKVLAGDMAVARPVYLRIVGHRVFWIPFYVFSLREDRQSGVLTPGFGRRPVDYTSAQTEWEVRNLGYYFAPSDYWDLTLSADLRERTGWLTRAALAYAWRYHFSGRLETRLQSRQVGQRVQWEWWTSGRHSQELGSSASLRADGTFQSNKNFSRDNSSALNDRLSRTLRSNLRFDKRWREAGYSLSVTASHTDNLDTERAETVLPDLSLRSNRKALIPGGGKGTSRQKQWYSSIYYDASARVRNSRRDYGGEVTEATRADASMRLTTQQRPASWLNLTSGLTETWRDTDLRDGDARAVRTDRFNASANLSQTFYGMFYPQVWRLTALRHVLKPDAGLSYSATRADTGGIVGFGGSGRPWEQNRRLNMRLSNSFWAKVLNDRDEEDKVRLAQLNLATSYDFDRETRPLADLSTTLTVDAGRRANTRLSLRQEFYDDDGHLRAPRLRQFEVSTTLRLAGLSSGSSRSGTTGRTGSARGTPAAGGYPGGTYGGGSGEYGYESGLQQDIERPEARRTLQLSHYYSKYRGSEARSWIRVAIGGTVRRHWHLYYSLNADLHAPGTPLLDRDRITAELLSIQREFHDWTATLNVEPSRFAVDRTFYFKVQLKDIPQIRFERGDRRGGR